jgi:hypothetical protein
VKIYAASVRPFPDDKKQVFLGNKYEILKSYANAYCTLTDTFMLPVLRLTPLTASVYVPVAVAEPLQPKELVLAVLNPLDVSWFPFGSLSA